MPDAIIFTAATGILWMLVGVGYSRAAEQTKNLPGFLFCYSVFFSLFIFIFQTPELSGNAISLLPVAIPMILSSFFAQTGFLALYMAMRNISHSVAWTFTQSAMAIPFLGAWLLFSNPVKTVNWIGFVLLTAALVVLGRSTQPSSGGKSVKSGIIWSITALLLTGISQLLTLVPNEMELSPAVMSWRLPFFSLAGALFYLIAIIVKRTGFSRREVKWGIIYGTIVSCGQITLYKAIDACGKLDLSNAVYPAAISLCIVLFTVYCNIFRREKLSLTTAATLLTMVTAVVMLFI